MIYNLIGRATVLFARSYLKRRLPASSLLIAIAAVAGLLVIVGGAALSTGSRTDTDY